MVEWSGKELIREKPLKKINDDLSYNASSSPGSLRLCHFWISRSLNIGSAGYAGLPSALAVFLYFCLRIFSMGGELGTFFNK